MSMSTEQDLLSPLLLIDSIIESLNSAAVMERMQQQARGDGYEDMFCLGFVSGIQFCKEQMWEQFKAAMWSNSLDQRDLELAKEGYEMQE